MIELKHGCLARVCQVWKPLTDVTVDHPLLAAMLSHMTLTGVRKSRMVCIRLHQASHTHL